MTESPDSFHGGTGIRGSVLFQVGFCQFGQSHPLIIDVIQAIGWKSLDRLLGQAGDLLQQGFFLLELTRAVEAKRRVVKRQLFGVPGGLIVGHFHA